MEPVPQTGIHVVGREAELAVLREFLAPEGVSGPLVIPGDPDRQDDSLGGRASCG